MVSTRKGTLLLNYSKSAAPSSPTLITRKIYEEFGEHGVEPTLGPVAAPLAGEDLFASEDLPVGLHQRDVGILPRDC
jgi:hypothetical protein